MKRMPFGAKQGQFRVKTGVWRETDHMRIENCVSRRVKLPICHETAELWRENDTLPGRD
ncbi:hypothetical protein [Bacillus marinisedimentorum]|uniref:hypothetical protein n=1 Tax=Bacillus marinisedimentorum TaxID=1821260 RepID=UPI000AA92CF4|nr:hypothetical protein [Bacillus marinisedimentorum]